MNTYAEYLATLTVKALNVIARDLSLKGYSKLRKAALVEIVARQVGMDEVAAYREVEHTASRSTPVEAPKVVFSAPATVKVAQTTPIKAPQIPVDSLKAESTSELLTAYKSMRHTVNSMGAVPSRVRILGKLRLISAELRNRKVTIERM